MYVGLPAPTNVNATVLTPNTVEVTWDQSPDVTGYLISCTSSASYASGKSVRVTGGDTTIHTLTDLVENTPYDIHLHGLTSKGRKSDCSTKVPIITQKAGKLCIQCNNVRKYHINTPQLQVHHHRISR